MRIFNCRNQNRRVNTQEGLNLPRYFIFMYNGDLFFFSQDGFQLYHLLQAKFNIFQFGTKSVAMHRTHNGHTHTHTYLREEAAM